MRNTMNRVIIVDDEIQSRTGIAEIFRRHTPSWEVCGLFADGLSALYYLQDHPEIDLIVTDIRMPRFDGLELISKIREINSSLPIIIISGYSEFSYAKKAVDYHVFRYILKPVSPAEFDAEVTAVENYLLLERTSSGQCFRPEEYEQFMDLLFSEAVSKSNGKAVQKLEEQCGFSFSGTWFLLFEGKEAFEDQMSGFRMQMHRFCKKISADHFYVFLFCQKIYCVLLKQSSISIEEMKKQVQIFLWKFPADARMHAGIYRSVPDDTFRNAFYSGMSALKQYLYISSPVHIYQDQLLCAFPHTYYQNLQLYLEQNSPLDVRDSVYSFMDYIKKSRPSYFELQSWINRIVLSVTKFCADNKLPSSCYIDYAESLNFLYNYHSLEEIEDSLLALTESAMSEAANRAGHSEKWLVRQVQAYLAEHVKENVTLSELGEVLGVNYTFLSSVYSSKTGQTIIETLTALKISRAKELLINTDKKIYEISSELGYSEPKYFARRFRQITGVTPKEYRKIYSSYQSR